MPDAPLLVRRILEHGSTVHAASEVVTAVPDGMRRASYATVGANAARLAGALHELGVSASDRVATFMWNNQQHLEAYFAVPAMGAVVHPLNIRLSAGQVTYIANHAEDRVIIVDESLLPTLVPLLPELETVEHLIVNGSAGPLPATPATITTHRYADLIARHPDRYPWPHVDELAAAALCYTSGTTGDPKGVSYSHRSIYLHALGTALPDSFGLSVGERVLAVVPQFHVLSWGLPYAALMTGADLLMPDRFLAPEALAGFIALSGATKATAVPTVWQGLLRFVEAAPEIDISSLREGIVGGATCPPSLFHEYARRGVTLVHVWGMTEMSPIGTVARPPARATADEAWRYRYSQGRFLCAVEARLAGPDGDILPHDGRSTGELEVRGPWVTAGYFRADDATKFHDGWLRTGDVGFITEDGYLTITDRAKDVIKSGGEWISSVELENHLMAHPAVQEAAVVAVPDERWGERPLAGVVLRDGALVSFADLQAYLADRIPRWQLPERWTLLAEVPKTSVGKFDKKTLRARNEAGELDVINLR